MRIATNDTRMAQFHDVIAWDDVAETAAETLRKGVSLLGVPASCHSMVAPMSGSPLWKRLDSRPRIAATELEAPEHLDLFLVRKSATIR